MPTRSAEQPTILGGVIEIVSAHLANNPVAVSEVAGFIRAVHSTLTELERISEPERVAVARSDEVVSVERPSGLQPAVPIDQSVQQDFIICLEDGRRLRLLKRYLMAQYGLTPDAYREKWGLPSDYPMAAPAIAEKRSANAKQAGFGKSSRAKSPPVRRRKAKA